MPDPIDLTEAIEQAALDPASASVDGQSATARPLSDLIEADRYLRGLAATEPTTTRGGSGWGCLRTARAVPPGSA